LKSKIFVENHWMEKAGEIASAIFGDDVKKCLRVKDECAKEIMWFISCNVKEIDLVSRIEKYKRMEEHDKILLKVDPYWRQRLEFLEWIAE
jgi:hypothetical protein